MRNVSIKFSRSKFVENTRTAAIIRLDSALHKVGQPVIVRYRAPLGHDGPNEVNTIFAIGIKDGTGRDCYDIVSLGELNLVQAVEDRLPDASSMIRGEKYLFRDPDTGLGYKVFLTGSERKIIPLTGETRIYTNVEDDYTWFLTDGVLKREDEFYSRFELDLILKALKEDIVSEIGDIIDDLDDRVKDIEAWMEVVDNPPKLNLQNLSGSLFLTGTTQKITLKINVTWKGEDITGDYIFTSSGKELVIGPDGEVSWSGIKVSTTFNIQARNKITGSTLSASSVVNFGYYFYYGIIPSSGWEVNEENVKLLSERVLKTKTPATTHFFDLNLEKIAYICPSTYGKLGTIKDEHGFDYTGDYDVQEVIIDGFNYFAYIKSSEVSIVNFKQTYQYNNEG